MLNGNKYGYNQQQPFEQQFQQNYRYPNDNNNNNNNSRGYYTPIGRMPNSVVPIKRDKSFKNILKKLQNAIVHGNFNKVQYYVENYGILNETEHSLHGGRTCLMLSISKDNYEMIDYFLQHEDINLDVKGFNFLKILFYFKIYFNNIINIYFFIVNIYKEL